MSLKVWIGREFETLHEREQIAAVVHCLRDAFEKTADQVNLLCNFELGDAPVDLAVVKSDAFIVVDLKTANGAVKGGVNGPWTFVDEAGAVVEMNKGRGRNKNPFIQMRNYRHSAITFLQRHASAFMSNQQLSCVKCIDRFVKANVLMFPSLDGHKDHVLVEGTYKLWFSACRLRDFCQLIQSQTSSFDFDERQESKLISQVLGLQKAILVGDAPAMPRAEQESSEVIREVASSAKQFDVVEDPDPQPQQQVVPARTQDIVVDATRPVIDSSDVRYISIGVKGAVSAKGLKGEVIEVFYQDEPTYDIPGAWGALCVFRYDGADKDILAVKAELDYYLEDEHASSIVGNRIVWAFPEHSLSSEAETERPTSRHQEPTGPRPLTMVLPSVESSVRTLVTTATFPRSLGYVIYSARCCPYSFDRRNGDDQKDRTSEESVDTVIGRYVPIAYCEAYCIFDMFFDRAWGKVYSARKELSIGVENGLAGGSLLGFLYALRRNAGPELKKVEVQLIGGEENEICIPLLEMLSNSHEFGFTVECGREVPSPLDFLLVCGRRDGYSSALTTLSSLPQWAAQMSDVGVIWLSDIAGPSFAASFGTRFASSFASLERSGWRDLTMAVNGSSALGVDFVFPQRYSCQVLGQNAQTSRGIVYRLIARGTVPSSHTI